MNRNKCHHVDGEFCERCCPSPKEIYKKIRTIIDELIDAINEAQANVDFNIHYISVLEKMKIVLKEFKETLNDSTLSCSKE